jgi:deoxycytidine triphosphate deaminase
MLPAVDSRDLSPQDKVSVVNAKEPRPMASLITGERLQHAVEGSTFIKNGLVKSVEGAKYDFRMSPVVLKSSFVTPVNIEKLPEDKRAQAVVEPGEVVFVKTMEMLDLPNSMIATLSPKRKLSHLGIIALGGFAVDPKYKGPLFIGLYNFSSTPFPLIPGRKLIAAMFYSLGDDEVTDFPDLQPISDQDEFPDDLISLIRNYKPIELKGLNEAVLHLQGQFDTLQNEVRDDRTWKKEFRDAQDLQTKQIDKLLEGLQDEKAIRKDEDAALRIKLEGMSNLFAGTKLIWRIVWTISAIIIGILGGHYGPKLFESKELPAAVVPQLAPPSTQTPPVPPGKT